jgi:hypothetical protein
MGFGSSDGSEADQRVKATQKAAAGGLPGGTTD